MAFPEKWNAIHRLVIIAGRLVDESVEINGFFPDSLNPFAKSPLDHEYQDIMNFVKGFTEKINDTNSSMAKYYRFSFEFTNHTGKLIKIYLHEQPNKKGAYFYEIDAGNFATAANTKDSFKHMLEQMADSAYDFKTFPKP